MIKLDKNKAGNVLGLFAALVFGSLLLGCDNGAKDSAESVTAEDREHVESMAREHASDTTEASGAADDAVARPVFGELIPYAEVAGELAYGYFVIPEDLLEPLPALIVIHEWWGLNDNIKAMADRLAGEGYIVLAVDMFGGKVANSPAEARELMVKVLENPDDGRDNIRQAYSFLKDAAGAPRVGSLGWCFGGGWSLNTALEFPNDLAAAVIYYGQVIDDEDKLGTLNVPIMGHFAANDSGIPVESVEKFRDALERLRKDYTIEIYPDASHAFANPTGGNYNPEAARKAWKSTLKFLADHLVVAEE